MMKIAIIIIASLAGLILGQPNCPKFLRYLEDAKAINSLNRGQNLILQSQAASPQLNVGYVNDSLTSLEESEAFSTVAKLFVFRDGADLSELQGNAACLNRPQPVETSRPKYRAMNGYGNNLKNPFWGAAETPFGRFGPKNYADGIHQIRKSDRTNQYLPSPRELVVKVLKKAAKTPRTKNFPNLLLLTFLAFISHDIGHSVTVRDFRVASAECCAAGKKAMLSRSVRESSCIPITIPKDDYFYNATGVRCMGVSRTQTISSPTGVQAGEIRNKATSFADISVIYGSSKEESLKIRMFSQGKLVLTPGQTLPMTPFGQFTEIAQRLSIVVTVVTWGVLLTRNHNNLAGNLAALNPSWDDEKLYQEARRINIAVLQNLMISKEIVQELFGEFTKKDYNPDIDASETVEFQKAAIRFNHLFVPSNFRLIDSNGVVKETPQSDLLGRVDILEQFFDDSVRGALNQSAFNELYSDELHNKFFKNQDGVGVDIFAFDIQRGRDLGLTTWMEARKKCGLDAKFTSFCDLRRILRKSSIKLLKKRYESVQDIDLYVGGALESFEGLDKQMLGPTFSCIFKDQYERMVSGDAYFFSHANNPNPFTPAQLKSITDFSFNSLMCSNSGIEFTNKNWARVDDASNPKVACSTFAPMNLQPWLNA